MLQTTFPENLKRLRIFKANTLAAYQVWHVALANPPETLITQTKTPDVEKWEVGEIEARKEVRGDNEKRLMIAMVILLCVIWDEFIQELTRLDKTKYESVFQPNYKKYYNDDIKEYFIMRDCFIHHSSKASKFYQDNSPVDPKKFALDEDIELQEIDIDSFIGNLEFAFNELQQIF